MKVKVTRKEIKENYKNIINVSYCNLQYLLKAANISPAYYCTRAEGWACDIYVINDEIVIVTGYAPFGNIKSSFDLCEKYEKKAQKLLYSNKYKKYTTIQKHGWSLLTNFVHQLVTDEEE